MIQEGSAELSFLLPEPPTSVAIISPGGNHHDTTARIYRYFY